MRFLLVLGIIVASLGDLRSARADHDSRLGALVFADVLVRNGDLLSASLVAGRDLAWMSEPGARLAINVRPRLGLGGASAAIGLLGYVGSDPWAPHLPVFGLNPQMVVFRSWWLSNWRPDTYLGGELGLEFYFVRLTAGAFRGLESSQTRFQIGVGLGV
jgi:hypothetical protein